MSENEEQPTQSAVESPVGSAAPANAEGLADATPKKKRRPRRKPSKRHCSNRDNVDRNKRYDFAEAVALLKRVRPIKFDETIELAVKLGIDSKQSDQQVRGTVILPRGTGKKVTVLVFAEGDKAEEARAAGADFVGSADLATRILKEGWVDFDIALATPDMMKIVGPLGRVLGPHGKMPSPKGGTLTADIGRAVEEFKGGKIEYRNDKQGNLCCPIGKFSFSESDILANLEAVLAHLASHRPPTAKGAFFRKAFLSSTMGPGIPLNISV